MAEETGGASDMFGTSRSELLVDFIVSLDGFASAEGWPGWWGLEGPEYLDWLEEQPEGRYTILMGANTYRLMSGFAAEFDAAAAEEPTDEQSSIDELGRAQKIVFSSTLEGEPPWPNTRLVRGDAVAAVTEMKRSGAGPMRTMGSLTLCRSLLAAGLVDRLRLVVFPVITGRTGRERIFEGYPDVALDLVQSRTFDRRLQLLEYVPTVLPGPPGSPAA
ncbi:dihydrofolate reductase [Georgenia soli]|uniref:Dihydrofolate reductase n=1 Tax=Georgenia soli TaxID=638953 RepID=A0A2A9EKK0_9MICO|nr:dihydrofolate reductase family protein [Georgenia soli]PFG39061.1 dihydrofolate reductase [Georgenia soli]